MQITAIRECTVPLQGNVANALVNFSEHTVSLVAVCTDVVHDGRPVVGLAFNSIGRFAQGGLSDSATPSSRLSQFLCCCPKSSQRSL